MPMSVTPTRWVTVPCWLKGMPCAAAEGTVPRASAASTTHGRATLERQLKADAHGPPRAVEAPRTEERVQVVAQRLGLLGNRVDVIAVRAGETRGNRWRPRRRRTEVSSEA